MAELGALSSYALSVQQMQMSLIKNSVEMQQEVIEILLGDGSRTVSLPRPTDTTSTSPFSKISAKNTRPGVFFIQVKLSMDRKEIIKIPERKSLKADPSTFSSVAPVSRLYPPS